MSAHGVGRRDMGASRDAALTRRIQNAFARPHAPTNSPAVSLLSAPRTDPDGPHSGIRLPPWVSDGKTLLRPGMKDARPREPVVGDGSDPLPRRTILLAASPKRAPPEVDNVIAERRSGTTVGRHSMVGVVAGDDLPQPLPLPGNGLV